MTGKVGCEIHITTNNSTLAIRTSAASSSALGATTDDREHAQHPESGSASEGKVGYIRWSSRKQAGNYFLIPPFWGRRRLKNSRW